MTTETTPIGAGESSPAPDGSARRDPRDYVCAGARRLAMCKSEWLTDWYISHSPRNDNQNAEGTWDEWVALARAILKADEEWKAQNPKVRGGAQSSDVAKQEEQDHA